MSTIVPPGGFAGFSQMTGASRLALAKGSRQLATGKRRTKRRAKRAKSTTKRRKRATAKRGKARLVKGSAAAKAYMAKIRRKRKR